jgi:hypothetical protein
VFLFYINIIFFNTREYYAYTHIQIHVEYPKVNLVQMDENKKIYRDDFYDLWDDIIEENQ